MSKIYKGVDLSRFNGEVDFSRLKSGVDFAVLRCSVGVPTTNPTLYGTDTKFISNADACTDNGIPFGVYHYSTALSVEQALEEAKLVIESIKGYKLGYPVYYDLEDEKTLGKLSKDEVSDIAIAFCDALEKAGYFAGIYANKNWLENKINYSRLTQYAVWLAQWASEPTWKGGKFQMWQYTSDGSVDGVSSRVDMNECYEDYPLIMSQSGLNGYEKQSDGNQGENPNSDGTTVYIVVSGDTMYGIAKKFGVTLDELKRANPQIPDYNLIYSGQKINIPTSSGGEPAVSYETGREMTLTGVELYSSAGGARAGVLNGVYYLYDGKDINGYYRVTNFRQRVGKMPIGENVTGYIKKSDIN